MTELLAGGILDEATMTFAIDDVFDNWSQAVIIVSGKGQYSGSFTGNGSRRRAHQPSAGAAMGSSGTFVVAPR